MSDPKDLANQRPHQDGLKGSGGDIINIPADKGLLVGDKSQKEQCGQIRWSGGLGPPLSERPFLRAVGRVSLKQGAELQLACLLGC